MKSQEKAVIRELPVKELLVRLDDCENKILKLRLAHGLSPLKNPLVIRNLKRLRAQIKTWLRQKKEQKA